MPKTKSKYKMNQGKVYKNTLVNIYIINGFNTNKTATFKMH